MTSPLKVCTTTPRVPYLGEISKNCLPVGAFPACPEGPSRFPPRESKGSVPSVGTRSEVRPPNGQTRSRPTPLDEARPVQSGRLVTPVSRSSGLRIAPRLLSRRGRVDLQPCSARLQSRETVCATLSTRLQACRLRRVDLQPCSARLQSRETVCATLSTRLQACRLRRVDLHLWGMRLDRRKCRLRRVDRHSGAISSGHRMNGYTRRDIPVRRIQFRTGRFYHRELSFVEYFVYLQPRRFEALLSRHRLLYFRSTL